MDEFKCVLTVIALIVVIFLYFIRRREKEKTIESIQSGKDVLVSWSYSPEDWKTYVEDASSGWIKNKDLPGEVFITPESIYVTNGTDEYFYEFSGERRVTHCTFFRSFLDLRSEWTQTNRGSMEGRIEYYHEDFRVFVPADKQEEVLGLVAEFKAMAEGNAGFSEKSVKNSEITTLFGNDKF
jgi:hypothetical protein